MVTAKEDEEATAREFEDIMHWFFWRWSDGGFKFSFMLVMVTLLVFFYYYPLFSVGTFGSLLAMLCFRYRKDKKDGVWADGKPVEEEWG